MNQAVEQPYAIEPGPQEGDRLRNALLAIIARLHKEAEDRVNRRRVVEQRWIRDLRQLHGEYEPDVLRDLQNSKKSTLFINQTGPKTDACEGRLSDMLFPTDDRNWGIKPTPVPEIHGLHKQAGRAIERGQAQAKDLRAQAAYYQEVGADAAAQRYEAQAQEIEAAIQQAAEHRARLQREMDLAQERAELMAEEIEDQLTECQYNIQARDAIRDACEIGTGIMKGPIAATDRARRSWRKVQGEGGAEIYTLEMVDDPRPAFVRVDPWNWFPDPDARRVEESESFFERHLHNKKGLRALARQPGFDADAIRRLLVEEPSRELPTYLSDLRSITGENTVPTDARYQVWEYRGPISAEEMRDICTCLGKEALAPEADVDPLTEFSVVIWFCENEILKFGIHHLDSGEQIYSVYNVKKDASSIWGFGIPYLMRASQKALNGAWRMLMDNAGLSTGPQIEIDPSVIEPADGEWTLTPRKIWKRRSDAQAGKVGIVTHNIESHQEELQAIIMLAKQFIDDETSISVLAQGEQGAHVTQTAQGMSILMNAVNVMFRRLVKQFDDDVTVPNLRRLYDWNMQFSPREEIKGDFEVDARGSSVLLARELQAANFLTLLQMTAHPTVGQLLKAAPLARKTAQAMMIAADDIIKTDEELRAEAEIAAQQPQQQDPRIEAARIDADTRLQVAQMSRDTEMMKLAQTMNMSIEKLRAMLQLEDMKIKSSERKMAAEIAVESRHAGGPGSGGYVSPPPAGRRPRGRRQPPERPTVQ